MATEPAFVRKANSTLLSSKCKGLKRDTCSRSRFGLNSTVRASHSIDDDKNKVYKQLGLFALKRKIEEAVIRAEILAPTALGIEEAKRNKQEEMIRASDLWDDPAKSNELLAKLAYSAKVVDSLKDLTYKVEEVKLITQLAEIDAINYRLFKQAYNSSLHVSNVLDRYEMSKLLKGPYDSEGACVVIKAGSEDHSEIWASRVLRMYTKWGEKQGYNGRVVEKSCLANGGIKSATIEFEFKFAYGYLSGERGVHYMINGSLNKSSLHESSSAVVDVVPVFVETSLELQIDDENLVIESASVHEQHHGESRPSVCIHHIPTGITVQSTGERREFANRMKALNRLMAKLLVIAHEQGVSSVNDIDRRAIFEASDREIRRYQSQPQKLVEDVKTGVQLSGLNSVLDGNLEPLIAASISSRQSSDKI